MRFLSSRTGDSSDLHRRRESYPLRNGNFIDHDCAVFFVRYHGSVSGSTQRHGLFCRTDDPFDYRYRRYASGMDFWNFSALSFFVCAVYFVSGFLAVHDHYAGDLLLFCKEKDTSDVRKRPSDIASGRLQRCTEEYIMRSMTCTPQQECRSHS